MSNFVPSAIPEPTKEIKPDIPGKITMAQAIDSRIWQRFIIDYGVVAAVSSDKKKVDVQHAIQQVLTNGETLDTTETKDVEVLYFSSNYLGIQAPLQKGDKVLLIGLKDYVEDTANVSPKTPVIFEHYTQTTLKAIPLGAFANTVEVKIVVDDSKNLKISGPQRIDIESQGIGLLAKAQKIKLKNDVASAASIFSDLLTHLISATTIPAALGAPLPFKPDTIANLTADKAKLALLFED